MDKNPQSASPLKVTFRLGPNSRPPCSVELDGKDITRWCRTVRLGAGVDNLTTLHLELINLDVEAMADVLPEALLMTQGEALRSVKSTYIHPSAGEILAIKIPDESISPQVVEKVLGVMSKFGIKATVMPKSVELEKFYQEVEDVTPMGVDDLEFAVPGVEQPSV